MLTFALAALVLVLMVAGAELVRSACQRQMMSAVIAPTLTSQPAEAHATAD